MTTFRIYVPDSSVRDLTERGRPVTVYPNPKIPSRFKPGEILEFKCSDGSDDELEAVASLSLDCMELERRLNSIEEECASLDTSKRMTLAQQRTLIETLLALSRIR